MSSLLCLQVSLRSHDNAAFPWTDSVHKVSWEFYSLCRNMSALQLSDFTVIAHYSFLTADCSSLFYWELHPGFVFSLEVYFHWIVTLTQTERPRGRNRRMWKTIKGGAERDCDIGTYHFIMTVRLCYGNNRTCDQQHIKTGHQPRTSLCKKYIQILKLTKTKGQKTARTTWSVKEEFLILHP